MVMAVSSITKDDFGQGILKIGQGKVSEFYFMKFVGTLIEYPI